MSGYVLDTTLIIDHVNGYPPGVDLMRSLFEKSAELFTCEVVTCEALSRGNEEQLGAVQSLLGALEYVALTPEGARWAGDRRRERIASGNRKPSTTDALIAALAHSLDATLVTRNAADFAAFDVPVLGYEQPLP